MRRFILLLVFMVASPLASAQRSAPITGIDPFVDVVDHSRFDSLWRASKSFGRLSTAGLTSDAYTEYRSMLEGARPRSFMLDSQIAFWVNAYLACLMETIHVRAGYRSTIWDSLYLERDTFHIAGEAMTLKAVQDQLLAISGSVLIRAVMSTGSTLQAPYPSHALYAKTVRKELRAQVRKIMRSERFVMFDPAGNTLQLGTVFEPWMDSMVLEAGSVLHFILPWVSESLAAQLALAGDSVRIIVSDRMEKVRRRR